MSYDELRLSVAKVVDAANAHRGRKPAQPFLDALNGLAALDGPDAVQKRSCVAAALTDITSASGAGFISVWLGADVERGADPFPEFQPLLDCFLRFTRQVKIEDGDITKDKIDEELAIGLEFLGQGIVAHLSKDLRSLRAVQANADVIAEIERVESYSPGPMWVLELIRKVSGRLIVLHGEQSVGACVEYHNISNCFHLFTLLQAALVETMPGARKVNSGVIAMARGERLAECSDEAWWHYGQPVSSSPNILTSVFGEQNPQKIHALNGQQVMLLWPPIFGSRTWDAGFFGPVLDTAPAEVELIEILSVKDVTTWRHHIGLPSVNTAEVKKPWWMFW
jgi:hypothetical protein